MPESFFKWIASSDRKRPHRLARPDDVKLRIAQLTDPHVPSDIPLLRRLRDLMRPHASASSLSHELSAISNELSQPYRRKRKIYTNLLKKALLGLRRLDVDHLAITGDLAHCGLASEFLEIKATLSITGWNRNNKLTVIPGNHDRFNLYERIPQDPMESFFDVVQARTPRVKTLPGGVVLVEIDSNSDRDDDRHYMEKWLPNTVGKIYPEVLDFLEKQQGALLGSRIILLIHHHVSMDWYARKTTRDLGGLMNPAEGIDELLEAARLIDPHAILLHGHIHETMPVDYTYNNHMIGNPGGFAETLRMNIFDVNTNDEITMTQIELRS